MRVELTVAGLAVAVEAVAAVAEVLADDVLTGGGRWTLVPACGTLVHICPTSTAPASLAKR